MTYRQTFIFICIDIIEASGMGNGVLWHPVVEIVEFFLRGEVIGYIMVTNNIKLKLKYLQSHNNYMHYIKLY